ncbi:hypothetical protein M8C21_013709, partial [Ambrosia artemisiifolia]
TQSNHILAPFTRAHQMEAKLERPKLDHSKLTIEETKLSSNLDPQSQRHGVRFIKLPHLATKEGNGISKVHSEGKVNCLCSPTSHTGSFRCRHHRTYSNANHNTTGADKSVNGLSNLAEGHD